MGTVAQGMIAMITTTGMNESVENVSERKNVANATAIVIEMSIETIGDPAMIIGMITEMTIVTPHGQLQRLNHKKL